MLHIDRPCHVCHRPDGSWMWRCLCSGPLEYTSTAQTWSAAYADADAHMRAEHSQPAAAGTVLLLPAPAPAPAVAATAALRQVAAVAA